MAAANANLLDSDDILKDVDKVSGGIHEAQSSNEPSKIGVGKSDEDDMKGEATPASTISDEVHMNEKEAIAMANHELPTIGKEAKNGGGRPVLLLNNLRWRCAKRGRSTLLLSYRLWRDHFVKKPPL